MSTAAQMHNRLAGEIVKSIVKPIMVAGGTYEQVLVLTESVVVGVILTSVRLGGDEAVLDVLVAGVKQRLAEMRLRDLPTIGEG
jgi:hypothetical protein